MKVPRKEDWGNFKDDLDVRYAYKLYGGQTINEALEDFVANPIERASELRFAPFKVFKYYVYCFVTHLTSDKSAGESDMASVFLRLVLDMSEQYPDEFSKFYPKIKGAIKHVVANQEYYDADYNIYGSFQELYTGIKKNIAHENKS